MEGDHQCQGRQKDKGNSLTSSDTNLTSTQSGSPTHMPSQTQTVQQSPMVIPSYHRYVISQCSTIQLSVFTSLCATPQHLYLNVTSQQHAQPSLAPMEPH